MLAEVSEWGLSDAIVVGLITFAASATAAWLGRRSTTERNATAYKDRADGFAALESTALSLWDRKNEELDRVTQERDDCLERERQRNLGEQ